MSDNKEEKFDPKKVLEYDIEQTRIQLKSMKVALTALERAIDEGIDGRFDPIAAKQTVKKTGMYPTRIVLLKWKNKGREEWSTHWQIFPPDRKSYHVHGHYYTNEDDARRDFSKREV